MLEVIGKAHYSVTYEGTVYNKIRYTLQLTELPKEYKNCDGVICDSVALKHTDRNDKPKIGDTVQVCYNRYGKPDTLIII